MPRNSIGLKADGTVVTFVADGDQRPEECHRGADAAQHAVWRADRCIRGRPHGERFAFSGLNLRRCGYASHRIFQKGRIKMRKSRVQRIWENAVVFYLGGMFYCTVELLWRQWTHG